MKYIVLPFVVCIIALAACRSTPSTIHPYYAGPVSYKATTSSIKSGEKAAKKRPDDEIVFNTCYKFINFYQNTKYDSAAYKLKPKEKLVKKISGKLYGKTYKLKVNQYLTEEEVEEVKTALSTSYTLYYTVSNDSIELKRYINELKMKRKKLPDGEVFISSKSEYSLTNLKDFNNMYVTVPYNQMTAVQDIRVIEDGIKETPLIFDMPYTDEGIFYSDARYKTFSLALPLIGNESHYEYEEYSTDAKFESVFYIQENHPVEEKQIEINVPDWLELQIIEKNFEGIQFTKSDQKISREKTKAKKTLPGAESDDNEKSGKKSGPVKTITYTFKNLKAFEDMEASRGASYNAPHLQFVYRRIKSGKNARTLMNSPGDLYKWYQTVTGNLDNNTVRIKPFTEKLVEGAADDEEKVRRIFYWIQDNIHYVAFEDGVAGFKPDECKEVFDKRYGDCKGMANLAKNMLKCAGLDGRLVWIGTRHLNYDYSTPGLVINNHAICAVKLNGTYKFIDPTESYCAYGDYAHRIQGRKVIIEDGENYILDSIPEFGPEHNTEKSAETYSISDKHITGRIEKTYSGESKTSLIRQYNYLETQDREKALYAYLTNNKFELVAENISSSDLNNRESDIKLTYDLDVKNHVYNVNNTLMVNLEWEREYAGYDIDTARHTDLDFGMKSVIDRTMQLTIPAGYSIRSMPAALNIDNPYYSISLNMQNTGSSIIYSKKIVIKQGYLPAKEYKGWNKAIKDLNAYYNDFIQLSK